MKTKLLVLLLFISVSFSFAQNTTTQNQPKDALSEFSISPNPAKDKLNLKLNSFSAILNLEVYDVLGKRIYKKSINRLETSIDVSNWKSGVYLVRVSNDETTQTKRFIKQ
ncbi:T9SS type A sorting domain-containing protein [uncultured Winogradskyella sp.]|uniref:T9SS type A sorting domain-containing protein n=1 Tax=uncultured Winogradskyella sp. TaxID=395353 RepID=UPI00262203F7|nr:T9SS type A sorting domain-containing protein [uncultured Winogradskyella sp.]